MKPTVHRSSEESLPKAQALHNEQDAEEGDGYESMSLLSGPRDVKVLKNSSRYGQRPEVKTLRVLGNQRLTPGGTVKRAKKPRLQSLKKRSQD